MPSSEAEREQWLNQAASLFVSNWSPPRQSDGLTDEFCPATMADAYRVQDRAVAFSGQRTGGWKLAITDAAAQLRSGISEPITGRLLADGFLPSAASVEASAFPNGRVVMECEVGVRMARTVRADGRRCDEALIDGAIDAVFVCIELPALRFRDMKTISASTFAADNAGAYRVVVGCDVSVSHLSELEGVEVCVEINEKLVATCRVGDLTSTPGRALSWLVPHLEQRGEHLRSGDVVLTGALTGVHPLAVGDRVVAEVGNLGRVEIVVV